jgi:hypothetical protein
MLIYPGPAPPDSSDIRQRAESVLRGVEVRGSRFGEPNPKGVFKGDVDGKSLVTEIGSRDEDYRDVSRRLLLLLESQPLWNDALFDSIRSQIVTEYTTAVTGDPSKQFVLLLNDLIRYFRTICVHYHYEAQSEYGRWPIRNIKLRHSRVLMYSSLLIVLGELSKYSYADQRVSGGTDKVGELQQYIGQPPLERFVRVYAANNDDNLFRLLGLYNVFLERLSDPTAREELAGLEYGERYTRSVFASLKANSDAFAGEINRFIQARRGAWSDRFYEYLII